MSGVLPVVSAGKRLCSGRYRRAQLSAPGTAIYATANGGGYKTMNGTSMASPMVTGIVALMLELNPKLTQTQIKDIIRATALNDSYTGDAINNKSAT